MKKRLELAGVQVAPSTLGRMVIDRKRDPAFGTRPTLSFIMYRPNVHLFSLDVQLNPVHSPRFLKPQNMTVKFSIFHDSDPFGAILSHLVTH
jgi:hypothetical protein